MFSSRPLQVALLLACGVTAVSAKEPGMVLGPGAITCRAYLDSKKDAPSAPLNGFVFAWLQGYFSARNIAGRRDHPLTVGMSLSADALESKLVDHCRNESEGMALWIAADDLYDTLQANGL